VRSVERHFSFRSALEIEPRCKNKRRGASLTGAAVPGSPTGGGGGRQPTSMLPHCQLKPWLSQESLKITELFGSLELVSIIFKGPIGLGFVYRFKS